MSNVAPDDGLPGRLEAILLKRTVGIRQGYWAAWGLVFGNQSCLNEPISKSPTINEFGVFS